MLRILVAIANQILLAQVETALGAACRECQLVQVDRLTLAQDGEVDLVVCDGDVIQPGDVSHAATLRRGGKVPLVALVASEADLTRVRRDIWGVDDYLRKPFSSFELVARVKAVLNLTASRSLRRETVHGGTDRSGVERFDDGFLAADPLRGRVHVRGRPVFLTHAEHELLARLLQGHGRMLSSRWLVERAWGYNDDDAPSCFAVHLRRLREKLEPNPAMPRYLLSEPGIGCCFRQSPANASALPDTVGRGRWSVLPDPVAMSHPGPIHHLKLVAANGQQNPSRQELRSARGSPSNYP